MLVRLFFLEALLTLWLLQSEPWVQPQSMSAVSPVPEFYGGNMQPLIIGLETCTRFRESKLLKPGGKLLGSAGLYNSGTNLLDTLLRTNCRQAGENETGPVYYLTDYRWTEKVRSASTWQVQWGKHQPLEWRGRFWREDRELDAVMPVVIVRDPLTWMKSMCRNPYEARIEARQRGRCPSPVSGTKSHVIFADILESAQDFESLVHFWSSWHRSYLETTLPRVMLRYEDLIYHAESVVKQLCKCVGGVMADEAFRQQERSAKWGIGHENAEFTGLADAQERAADRKRRLQNYSAEDLRFVRENWLGELARRFHYHHDIEEGF